MRELRLGLVRWTLAVVLAGVVSGCLTREVWEGHQPHKRSVTHSSAEYPVGGASVAPDGKGVAVAFNAVDRDHAAPPRRPECFRLVAPTGWSLIVPLLDRLAPANAAEANWVDWSATLQSRDRNHERDSRRWMADVTVRGYAGVEIGGVDSPAAPDATAKSTRLADALRMAGIEWTALHWTDASRRTVAAIDPLASPGARIVGRLPDGGRVAFPAHFTASPERISWALDGDRVAWSITERWGARRDDVRRIAGWSSLKPPEGDTLRHVHVDVEKRRQTWRTLGRIALTPLAVTTDAAGILAIAWLEAHLDDDCD